MGLGIFLLDGAFENTFIMEKSDFVKNTAVYGGGFQFLLLPWKLP